MDVELYIETGEQIVEELVNKYSQQSYTVPFRFLNLNKDTLEKEPVNFNFQTDFSFKDVRDVGVQSDGKLIVIGGFTKYNGVTVNGIVRLNTDGTRDTTFNVGGSGFDLEASGSRVPSKLLIEENDNIIVGGSFSTYNGVSSVNLIGLNSNGSVNQSFTYLNPTGYVTTIQKDTDGKILVGGNGISFIPPPQRFNIFRLNSDLTFDATFNAEFNLTGGFVSSIVPLSDGKILVAGNFSKTVSSVTTTYILTRLNSDGSIDENFLHKFASGVSGSPLYSSKVLLDSQNRIIMHGADSVDGSLVRYSYDGEIDTTFSYYGTGYVFSVVENIGKGYIISGGSISGYDGYNVNTIIPIEYSGNLQQDWIDKYNGIIPTPTDSMGFPSSESTSEFVIINDTLYVSLGFDFLASTDTYRYIKTEQELEEVPRTTYERLDMFDDEKISMKLKNADSSDLGKVFSEFTQSFSVPASDKNNRLLKYNYKTEVVTSKKTKFKAKIYVKGNLFKSGNFIVGETKFKNLRPSSHSLNFVSSVFNLKDIVKEDTLNTLNIFGGDNNWTLSKANTAITTPSSTFICPLICTNEVWNYGLGGSNDISLTANKIRLRDIRPAISFKSIFNSIITKYNFNIDFPFQDDPEFYNLFMWLNGYTEPPKRDFDFINAFGSVYNPSLLAVGQTISVNTSTDVVTVSKANNVREQMFLRTQTSIENVTNADNLSVTLNIIDMRPSTQGQLLGSVTVDSPSGSTFTFTHRLNSYELGLTTGSQLLYKLEYTSNFPINVGNTTHKYSVLKLSLSGTFSTYSYESINNSIKGQAIDLNKSFPDMKVIDFLTGIIKLFNIEISSDKYVPNKMYWKPKPLIVRDVLDFTDTINILDSTVKNPKRYKKFEFRHQENNFYSTEAFKIANVSNVNSKAFGELIYTDAEDITDTSYKIESPFSITPTRVVEGSNIEYIYGFEYDATISEAFTPNSKDTLIFYNVGINNITKDDGTSGTIYLDNGTGGQFSISQYNRVTNSNNTLEELYTNSLGYKDEVNSNPFFVYNKNLFSNFYKDDITRLYNRGTKIFTYNAVLNANQILDLSAEKHIVIRDEKFSIEEVDLDITSGQAKFTIMNYAPVNLVVVNYPPTP